jgi:predicted sugar kinase
MLSHSQPQQVLMVAGRISRYLESCPKAFDSLEGILRWWLLKQHIEESTELVQAAMDYLVSSGEVEQIKSSGKTFYASASQKKSDGTDDVLNEIS